MSIYVALVSLSNFLPHSTVWENMLSDGVLLASKQFPEKKKQQFLAGRWLLTVLLQKYYQYSELPEFGQPQNGRPCFLDATVPDFNISHSKDHVIVAVSQDKLGIDIETRRAISNYMLLAEHQFSKDEIDYLGSIGEQSRQACFWRLWTMREALLKCEALSVWQMRQVKLNPFKQQFSTDLMENRYLMSFEHDTFTWALATSKEISSVTLNKIHFTDNNFSLIDCELLNHQSWVQLETD